ncbi:TIR domain-containing protein [Tenacibaculum discolor]|uniref:TIR domain-containing protein n=1 Tax=Tenacibaculum discolor TaxID=361581 RepID=UPI000F5B1210|nr:TIR domain-containing protein [Tenacibaculum discolor]
MGHKCFITFKTEDAAYKKHIQEELDVDMIDKSLNEPIDSDDEDYIMRKIREDYLSDSTVTICLIGTRSSENLGWDEQRFIKRELQASLYNGQGNSKSGILGVVLPSMYGSIYTGSGICNTCGRSHNHVNINDSTTVKEFSYNYYIPNDKCAWTEEDRYCVLVKWEDFEKAPNDYIDKAFDKRSSDISSKTKVRP